MRRALLLSLFAAAPLAAQVTLTADAPVYAAPSGVLIGTLKRGAAVRPGKTNGAGWTAVTIEGWIASTRVATRNDSLDRSVTGRGSAQVRVADGTNQPVFADVELGAALKRVNERNGWTQVRRSAWIRSSALPSGRTTTAAAPPPRRPPPAERPAPAAATPPDRQRGTDANNQRALRATTLRSAPGGEQRATVRAGTSVETIARDGGWARIRIEGWVPERDLMIADSTGEATLSAADLRSNPAAHRGKTVRWEVQVISLQRADVLRKGMAADEPYLIARGPGNESAILYLAVPPALLDQARSMPQLGNALITARVREGRSDPVGVPILDLIGLIRIP